MNRATNPFKSNRKFGLSRRTIYTLLLPLLLIVLWQNTLSAPDPPARKQLKLYQYPDIFALRTDYADQFEVVQHTIQSGDSFYAILQEFQLPAECSLQWQRECAEFCQLSRIQPGDSLEFHLLKESRRPFKIVYQRHGGPTYVFRNRDDHWQCRQNQLQAIDLEQTVTGTIRGNLYDSCRRAGLPAELIMELADRFAFDIDFNTDIRNGDSFAIHFRRSVANGRELDAGPILAAEMIMDGTSYQAFRYELPDGYQDYFDAEGHSLRKLFLKAPLSYRRISSTFTHRRYHPILRIYRPHLGIDYAAPRGTPIRALGDGKVVFRGRKGGFGNYIVLRHGSHYKTAYGHLLRFAKGIATGRKVQQGQVIGYVGSSGLATGPHLDFRFYKNGKPINFLKTKFPHARSIPKKFLADFNANRRHYLALLRNTRLARNSTP